MTKLKLFYPYLLLLILIAFPANSSEVRMGFEIEMEISIARNISRHYPISQQMLDTYLSYLAKNSKDLASDHADLIKDYPRNDPEVLNRIPEELRKKLLAKKLNFIETPQLSLYSDGFRHTGKKPDTDYARTTTGILVPARYGKESAATTSLEAWNKLSIDEALEYIDPNKLRKEVRVKVLHIFFNTLDGSLTEYGGEKTVIDLIPSFSIGRDVHNVIEWRTTEKGLYESKQEAIKALKGFAKAAGYPYEYLIGRDNILSQKKSLHLNISSEILKKHSKAARDLLSAYTNILIQKETGSKVPFFIQDAP